MKVMVFGRGWLGNKIANRFVGTLPDVDILDRKGIQQAFLEYGTPDVVINAAGKCGRPNIDWCEKPENKYTTWAVNALGPAILESVCLDNRVKFVHLSSGCLWERGSNIDEFTKPDPPSWYSYSKAEGESRLSCALIVRPRMPVDWKPDPRNLITKLSKYQHVLNVPNSVTVIDDLLDAMDHLIRRDLVGIFNVVNSGAMTGVEVMEMYREFVDPNHKFEPIDMAGLKRLGLVTAGRSNVTLNTNKLQRGGFEMPSARQRVEDCMKQYALEKDAG